MHQHLHANLRVKRADFHRMMVKKKKKIKNFVFDVWHKTELRVKNQAQFRDCDGFQWFSVVSLSGLQGQWLNLSFGCTVVNLLPFIPAPPICPLSLSKSIDLCPNQCNCLLIWVPAFLVCLLSFRFPSIMCVLCILLIKADWLSFNSVFVLKC